MDFLPVRCLALLVCATYCLPTALAQEGVADPLQFCTWAGGTGFDEIRAVTVDSQGNSYFAGHTDSTDLPTLRAVQPDFNGGDLDVYVGSFDPDGGLRWLTYLGGNSRELAYDISVSPDDTVVVVGGTSSADFPKLVGPFTTLSGDLDGFVTRFTSDGNVVSSGFIGGSEFDSIRGSAIGPDGSVYVVGRTRSDETSFPVLVGPDLTFNDVDDKADAFIAKVGPDAQLVYAGYIGGEFTDYARSVAVNAEGSAFVAGWTNSSESTFPVAEGPDLTYNGGAYDYGGGTPQYGDGFVAEVAPHGDRIVRCGYIGGRRSDAAFGIAIDESGYVYLGGHTNSPETTFPTIRGPELEFQGASGSVPYGDGWVAKLQPDFKEFEFIGYLGGEGSDRIWKIALGKDGLLHACGNTRSRESSFPHHGAGARMKFVGKEDAFISTIDTQAVTVLHSSVFGGGRDEMLRDIEVAANGDLHFAGWSESSSYPVVRAWQANMLGSQAGIVGRIVSNAEQLHSGNTRAKQEQTQRVILRVNGSLGEGRDRLVRIPYGEPVSVSVEAIGSPGQSNPTSGFVIYAWFGEIDELSYDTLVVSATGARVGTASFPMPINNEMDYGSLRATVANSYGKPEVLGYPRVKGVKPAPTSFDLPAFAPRFVLQGVIENPNVSVRASVTNAITVQFVP